MAKGVKHYKKDGTVWAGEYHKMPDGSLHTNKTHTKNSVRLYHYGQLSDAAKKKAMSQRKKMYGGGVATGERNYRKEYDNYQGSTVQKKRRASRNAARSALLKTGAVKKGDGKDVSHRNGNPTDNSRSNLGVQTASNNRSYSRTRTAGKRNPRA